MIESYEAAVTWLYDRVNFERLGVGQYDRTDFKLLRMQRLLEHFGKPHLQIPAIHIAGTKGKGTTASVLAEILKQAGYRVGLFTSPHMQQIEERFVINGEMVSRDEFLELVRQMEKYVQIVSQDDPELVPTFFEILTAMAWLHFTAEEVDLAVLEVGLGGRLDSTNLCRPIVTAISSISLDHTRLLGSTVEEISQEKGGIIKPGIPVVTSVNDPRALGVVENIAKSNNSSLRRLETHFGYEIIEPWTEFQPWQRLRIWHGVKNRSPLEISFGKPGPVYGENLSLAIACIDELNGQGYTISEEQIQQGCETVRLPLRFEHLAVSPLIFADAAHNPASMASLVSMLRTTFPGKPLTMILAISRDKDYEEICRTIDPSTKVIATQYLGNSRSLSAIDLHRLTCSFHPGETFLADTPTESLAKAREVTSSGGVIVATGSLFLAAEIRQLLLDPESSEPTLEQTR